MYWLFGIVLTLSYFNIFIVLYCFGAVHFVLYTTQYN